MDSVHTSSMVLKPDYHDHEEVNHLLTLASPPSLAVPNSTFGCPIHLSSICISISAEKKETFWTLKKLRQNLCLHASKFRSLNKDFVLSVGLITLFLGSISCLCLILKRN